MLGKDNRENENTSNFKQEVKSEPKTDKVIAENMVIVTNDEQSIDWNVCGLKLHIPNNSLPEGCNDQIQLNMTVSRPADCTLPAKDGILVSALYSFSHNLGGRKFRQPVTLAIQQSVASSYSSSLSIVQSNDISPPYNFHFMEGGNFDGSDGYGYIKLDHFCSFGVYLWGFISSKIWTLKPCAVLYYTNIKSHSFQLHMYITLLLNAFLKVCCIMLHNTP